jgi:D-alanyl-lipoteichoic acid acyltransferase DltB (MBOAT superfamily)
MDVTSFQFLGFTFAAGLVYNLRRSVVWRQATLFAADLIFLAAIGANWKSYVPLTAFLGIGYAGIRLMQRKRWRNLFVPVAGTVVFLFIWLKQYSFLPAKILLPFSYLTIGLSYIFFRVVHMIADARDGAFPEPIRFIPYLTYTLNFTTMAAGPIQFYPDFVSSQLNPVRPPLTLAQCGMALERVAIGFFKLKVLSSILLAIHQSAVGHLSGGQALSERVLTACVIVAFYPAYLYFNFSGFVDLMIGASRIFRLGLPENFDRPFSAASFIEFWSRWHMTLSNWLKTYVYTPMVKVLMSKFPSQRVEPFIGVAGFFVTFFLVGVWHGQTSEFLCFGLMQGGGVSLNKLYQVVMVKALGRKRFKLLDANTLYRAFSRGLTFTYFAFTLIWFWSNWEQMNHLASALTRGQEIAVWVAVWLGSSASLAAWDALRKLLLRLEWDGASVLCAAPVRLAWAAYLTLLALIASSIVTVSTPVLYQIF